MSETKYGPGDQRIHIKWLQHGQAGAYQDTMRIAQFFFEWIPYALEPGTKKAKTEFEPYDTDSQELILQWAGGWLHWTPEGEGDWASPRLDYCKKVGPGRWEIAVREAFTD